MDDQTPLTHWRETMHPRLARLRDFEVPGLPLDSSAASLELLEAAVIARAPIAARWRRQAGFTEAAMGYLGEVLLNTAGGHWGWDDEQDAPVVHVDPALHRPPISPLRLIVMASERRTGDEFTRVRAELAAAVRQRQTQDPDWSPVKEPTPAVDVDERPVGRAFLDRWLPERAGEFPQWTVKYAGGVDGWDYAPGSLDRLEAAVRATLSSLDDFDRPEYAGFIEGASWYLGEVFIRNAGGQWGYNEGAIDPTNMWVGRPFIERFQPTENATVPFYELRGVLRDPEPGRLRRRLDFFR